jgi:pyrroline-5-carboxylate reductase
MKTIGFIGGGLITKIFLQVFTNKGYYDQYMTGLFNKIKL